MPILFGLFGIILIVSGVRGRVSSGNPSLVSLIKDDFTGTDPFWKWMLAILLIGAIGYIPNLRPVSRAFMALVIVVFLLSNKGIFTQLQNTFTSTPQTLGGNIDTVNTQVPATIVNNGVSQNVLIDALGNITSK